MILMRMGQHDARRGCAGRSAMKDRASGRTTSMPGSLSSPNLTPRSTISHSRSSAGADAIADSSSCRSRRCRPSGSSTRSLRVVESCACHHATARLKSRTALRRHAMQHSPAAIGVARGSARRRRPVPETCPSSRCVHRATELCPRPGRMRQPVLADYIETLCRRPRCSSQCCQVFRPAASRHWSRCDVRS